MRRGSKLETLGWALDGVCRTLRVLGRYYKGKEGVECWEAGKAKGEGRGGEGRGRAVEAGWVGRRYGSKVKVASRKVNEEAAGRRQARLARQVSRSRGRG